MEMFKVHIGSWAYPEDAHMVSHRSVLLLDALPIAAGLSSFFLWLAENIRTHTQTWVYSRCGESLVVSFQKMGSWYMLLYLSFATVAVVNRPHLFKEPHSPHRQAVGRKMPPNPQDM